MISTTATHLQPTRHNRHRLKGFVRAIRATALRIRFFAFGKTANTALPALARDSFGREQGSLLQGLSVLSIEKDGTGIEKNGTGVEKDGTGIEKDGTGSTWEIVA